jgi:hypothetical protein
MRIPFGTNAWQVRSVPFSAQDMVNCYLEIAPPAAKTFAAVVQTYGIRPRQVIGSGYARGGIVLNGIPYVVYGAILYRLTLTTATALGTVPGANYVDMAGDGINIMLVTDDDGYYYDGTTVQQITDPDFPGAAWVENIDGYYVVQEPNSGRFYVSANRDPSSWDALEFATAEQAPDDLVGGLVNQGELCLFGKESFEFNYVGTNTDFPLERTASGSGDIGLLSRFGAANCDNTIFFPGHDGIVYRMDGYTPVRISQPGIEQAIENMADKTCFSMSWKEGGHSFYSLSFDTMTLVYDVSTQLWHRRKSINRERWRPLFILRAFDTWITGDFYTNELGELDPNYFQEFGETLISSAISPPVGKDNEIMAHDEVQLVFQQGVGLASGQGYDPKVMLQWSDDGGRTWSSERWRALGKMGEYRKRGPTWNALGSARDRCYRFAISDPVRRTLILATTEAA